MLRNRAPLAKRRQGVKDFAIFPMRQPILQLTPSQAASPTRKLGLQPPSGRTFQKLVSDRSR
ncbi:hypothetical protein H6F78_04580 [Coleofasciculus sp. FACHB-64]|uniref:hypothetical protein n=1 Tax=unclassified Coleofasciculus TaxID=2692782 RepID=UPI001683CE87|nr:MULTISPECIES: hypothetical protein [unclassified Coleofasciculus]MBD2044914.1 hypothetical protein [Coleofasciculus sp. FACHB-64]